MALGKSVRIYLADGTVSGPRHAEIANWSGQAIACSRAQFSRLKEWEEARRPGVYFLFGVDDQTAREVLYIGEAEIIIDRLGSHVNGKDFWNEVIFFSSKDDHLTKAHVRFLEARLVQIASAANRYSIKNNVAPQVPSLPRADRDAMEEFISSIKILLGVLGHKALEPLTVPTQSGAPLTLNDPPCGSETGSTGGGLFSLNVAGIKASALRTNEGIVVLAGSQATANPASSLSGGYRSIREKLLASGVIVERDGKLVFSADTLFSSPSQAGAIVLGYSVNGREIWRGENGKSWGDFEREGVGATTS